MKDNLFGGHLCDLQSHFGQIKDNSDEEIDTYMIRWKFKCWLNLPFFIEIDWVMAEWYKWNFAFPIFDITLTCVVRVFPFIRFYSIFSRLSLTLTRDLLLSNPFEEKKCWDNQIELAPMTQKKIYIPIKYLIHAELSFHLIPLVGRVLTVVERDGERKRTHVQLIWVGTFPPSKINAHIQLFSFSLFPLDARSLELSWE